MRWIVMSCVIALASGCVRTDTYCDLADPILFGSEESADWLVENDAQLVSQIIGHNELLSEICR